MFSVIRSGAMPYVIGHRGARSQAPENTIVSFMKGFDLGVDVVECDVHLSRDGHLVVIHDDSVDRTTNGHGFVRDLTLAELKRLDAGRGERIPTFEELLSWLDSRPGLGLAVEIKPSALREATARAVAQAIGKHALTERSIAISFDWPSLSVVKKHLPELATGVLYHRPLDAPWDHAQAVGAIALMPALELVDSRLVTAAHAQGLGVFTWTVNTLGGVHRALASGVDGIASDAPELVRAALAARIAG